MDKVIDIAMTKLFQLAEYVSIKYPFVCGCKLRPQTKDTVKSVTFISSPPIHNKDKIVEGELFK